MICQWLVCASRRKEKAARRFKYRCGIDDHGG
jgi:hypothetical protein